jgi:medium-chain acyl-[acyl-carrier-protein] hydrolase
MSVVNPSEWFVRYQNHPATAPVRLFAFPFAGGGASIYREWGNRLRGVDVYSALLPGRERRLDELPIGDLHQLLDPLLPALLALADRPFILFGHSMGALIAYELARRLKERGISPAYLIVSGYRSPDRPRRNRTLHHLPDAELVDALRDYGGTPAKILEHEEMLQILLPMLRADFRLNETYVYTPGSTLNCPLTALAGLTDKLVTPDEMTGWGEKTEGDFSLVRIPGGHFFILECPDLVLETVQNRIYGLANSWRARASEW